MTEAWRAFPAPGLIPQFDGSAFASRNCAAATWAGLAVSQQQGKRPAKGSPWFPTGASLRSASGDRSGGILPSTLDATVNRIYGIDLIPRITTVDTAQALLEDGYSLGFLHQYGPISDAGLSCSPGFRGAHSSGLYGETGSTWLWADTLADGRRTGIFKGMRYIARATAIKAGESLVIDSAGTTMVERYGHGHLYIVQTTNHLRPPLATVVTSAPASADERRNVMIRGAYGVTSSKVMHLAATQPLFASPGGPRVTRLSKTAVLSFLGKAGASWGLVLVGTGVPYTDRVTRPTGLYVPLTAGTITNR